MSGVWVERPHQLPDGYVPPSASLTPPANVEGDVVAEHPLIAFLRARWDEESTELDEMTGGALVQGYLRNHGERLKADIAAKRRILEQYRACVEDFTHIHETVTEYTRRQVLEEVIDLLAKPYAGRDDYPKDQP